MSAIDSMISGEFKRVYDDRYRIALPTEFLDQLRISDEAVIAKERNGCLSLWHEETWKKYVQDRVDHLDFKLQKDMVGRSDYSRLQRFIRLLSTRSKTVKLGQRGRLLIPEGFREFLNAEPGQEVILVGCGICVEIWRPELWTEYLKDDIENFEQLLQELTS